MATSILHFEWKKEWGSAYAGHREAIRARIAELVPSARGSALDLSRAPDLSPLHASISHCPSLGGFAIATVPVGIDFEERSRIDPALVAKIARLEEFAAFPEPAMLWVAKEAAFKCVKGVGLEGISAVPVIHEGTFEDGDFFRVPLANPLEGRAFAIDGVLAAIVTELSA